MSTKMEVATADLGIGTRKTTNVPTQMAKASNFDYDSPILIEDTQAERMDGFVRPTGSVTGDGPFEFVLQPAGDSYLLMGNLYLYTRAKIVKEGGGNLTAADVVAPVNCLGTAFWEHTETILNDISASGSSSSHTNYKGYLETVLSYDSDSKHTHLRSQLFALDTPGSYQDFTVAGDNMGFRERRTATKDSNTFDFCSPITSDFVRASNHLAPGNKLAFKFYRARDSFLLCSSTTNKRYKIKILDLRLYYQRVRLRDNIPSPRNERYLMTKTELKFFHVARGQSGYAVDLVTGGRMPKSIVIAQVETRAADGEYDRNPFYFQHFNLKRLNLVVNGRRVPSDSLTPNFDNTPPLVNREYTHMFMNTGTYRTDRGNCITLPAFQDGMSVFPFDLTPDMCNSLHVHSSKMGLVGLELEWAVPLADPITILVHCSYDAVATRKQNEIEFRQEII